MKLQNRPSSIRKMRPALALAAALAAPSLFAASETWTNAPADSTWTNVLNWVGRAVPGSINLTGNTTDGSVVTFNTPIAGGIGGAGNPIQVDNATISGDRARQISGIVFDTTNCGAYVISQTAGTTFSYPSDGILNVSHAGSITMNAPVTNSETFLIPLFVRLPSSTAGVYSFVNNSTNPSATLFFSSVTNDSANTRGTMFTLDGSNTGTNTIAALSKGNSLSTGVGGIIKQGAGRWILSGTGDWISGSGTSFNINGGVLEVQQPSVFGTVTTASVNTNGTLQIDGVTLTQTIKLNQSGAVRMNGSATIDGVTVSTSTGATPAVETTSASDVLTLGDAANLVTGGAMDSVLHIAGPGTVDVTNANNYAGNWSVDAGTLAVMATGALGTGLNLNIAAGATFDVTRLTASGGSYTPGTAGIGGSGSGTVAGSTAATIKSDPSGFINLANGSKAITLNYAPTSFTGDSAHPALYVSQGTLSLGGNSFTINNTGGTPLGVGTYQLILQASGSIASAGGYSVTAVSGSGLAAGAVGSIVVNGAEVDLVVAAYVPKDLVWTGGNPNDNWDINTTANFLNGATHSVFENSDNVLFNSTGSTNPVVDLAATLAPGSVTVDTTANNYTFSGSGLIAGTTGLTKTGTGTLLIQTVNTYGGGTVVSNGILQLGVNQALPDPLDAGSGGVALQSSGKLDLNTFSTTINALTGSGTVDNTGGGASTLTVGYNNDSGTFSGTLQNTSGTLGLTKVGIGTETLTVSNSYTGATTVNNGTLRVLDPNGLGGGTSPLTINGGTLDASANLVITNLGGNGGEIANNSTTGTNTLIINSTSTFGGSIVDGSGGGGIAVLVNGGTLRFNGLNTYSGGTFVASGSTLAIQGGASAGNGDIVLSNSAYLSEPSASSTAASYGEDITTVPGGTAYFTSAELANGISGNFYGGTNTTNIFLSALSISAGSVRQFDNFWGKAYVTNGGQLRFSSTGLTINGGTNTWFDVDGELNTRNGLFGTGVSLGALSGSGTVAGGDNSGTINNVIYLIGAKGLNTTFSGTIANGSVGNVSIIKEGPGSLALDGGTYSVISLDVNDNLVTNTIYTNTITYTGDTTISNGMLVMDAPALLTNSPTITLAASNVELDASQMGYPDSTGTNLVINGVFEVVSGQTLTGIGTINASNLLVDPGAILNVGLPTGWLKATHNVELAGTVNMALNRGAAPNSSELSAPGFTIDSTATLVVTNTGAALYNGDKFQLLNVPETGFLTVTLPATDPTGTTNYIWQNNLGVDGSIVLMSGGLTLPPAPVVSAVSGSPTNGFAPLAVAFTDTVAGTGTNWVWSFGNGNSVTNTSGVNVTNTYASAGTYTVTLTVYGPGGSGSLTLPDYVVAYPTPAISSVAKIAGQLVLGGTNGPAGVQYRIITATNLKTPLASWVPVYTNTISGSGTFSFTNSMTNNTGFFKLVSP